jgi:hypothetical protein
MLTQLDLNQIILTEGEGTIDLLIKVARFISMVNNIFNMKRNRSKLVSTRRSTVLSLSLQLVFPV